MAFQFVHLESYSRKPDSKGRSTGFVLAEARRDPAASIHVPSPGTPVVIYGVTPEQVESLHDKTADAARTTPRAGKPRKIRVDQHTLLAVVASHPHTVEEVHADPRKRAEVERWEELTVAWLQRLYGDALVSVIRHEDESHWHLHAYVLPQAPDMKAATLHPGQMAKAEVMAVGPGVDEDSKILNRRGDQAYRAAMRVWQDSYFDTVGVKCGLTRLGPARRRLTREQWQAERTQAKALRNCLDRAEHVQQKAESFIVRTKTEAESLVASAEAEAADLRDEALTAKAESSRQMEAAKAATAAALAAQDRAIAEQRRARSMMSRVRKEAGRVQKAAARIQRLPSLLRTLWDGFRVSRLQDRIRQSVDDEMSRLREQAVAAAERASAADVARKAAEEKRRTMEHSLAEVGIQRDAAWRELAKIRPPEAQPSLSGRLRPRP
ncbi:hypothetical protein IB237_00695 [Agrobacterium sp. AGB01]|uniref:hypothetical protein n=1 Tax=Agrobacterium sp. AGB01 TaxID=2769302 RepID=UPI0017819F34|nr:hypothetical protein [Agrobacterium sp. AGB01]MBD9385680.1 hypothetical protein [Agrobacterium sp. AGB01]